MCIMLRNDLIIGYFIVYFLACRNYLWNTPSIFCMYSIIPYWRYISAEINAEILTILSKSRQNISRPKINSAEYLSPPKIKSDIYCLFLHDNFTILFYTFESTVCTAVHINIIS